MDLIEWTIQRHVGEGIIRAGFTHRHGGVSAGEYASLNLGPHVGDAPAAVARNRDLLAAHLGCEPAWMEQVHGDRVARARPMETSEKTDGLVLSGPGKAACVMVADCVPLLIFSNEELSGAVVHVGRAGFMKEIACRAVQALDVPSENLTAVVGPSICGKCYEVPARMREEAGRMEASSVSETSWGTPAIDIPAGLRDQLRGLGVRDVVVDGRCTLEDTSFHSHRRSTRAGLSAGRFVGVLQFLSDTPA